MEIDMQDNGSSIYIKTGSSGIGGEIHIDFTATFLRDNEVVDRVTIDGPEKFMSEDPLLVSPPDEEIRKAGLVVAERLERVAVALRREYGEKAS